MRSRPTYLTADQ